MISVDKMSRIPVYEQVITQFEKLIASGVLGEEELIPSVRALALSLAVNPNTIQKAYLELESAGITHSVPGVGRFVSKGAKKQIEDRAMNKLSELYQAVESFHARGIDRQTIIQVIDSVYGG